MKSKFDIAYQKIKNKISLIVEDFSSNEEYNENFSKFEFKKDDDGNVICTFSINNNNENFIVVGKYFNDNISFVLTDDSGNSINYTEKEFSTNYNKDYENFKKELQKYLDEESEKDINDASKIESFDKTMDDEINRNPDVRIEKDYEIQGMKFLFKLLNDLAVENYCECIFDFQDEKTHEMIYARSLLNIMKKNSIIIKILLFNDQGELLDKLSKSEFLKRYYDIEMKLEEAINKFEIYVEEMK